tara:strand:+ start:78 stop:932 length:855 start_codon:yes stop_codon:yes gene_type:complete
MKIYNEIVIDMNPESSTFEETLYEDSFEHEGDMMLMQENEDITEGNRAYIDSGEEILGNTKYWIYEWKNGAWVQIGFSSTPKNVPEDKIYDSLEDATSQAGTRERDWGAPNITQDMFVNPDGTKKTVQEIYTTLDPILTDKSGSELVAYINNILPQFAGVPEEEKEFAKKAYEADVYELRPEVGGAIKPTTGVGMRASIGTQAGIKKGFEAAETTYEKDIYGLKKGVAGAYETDVVASFEPEFFGDSTEEDFEADITPWGTFRKGGRVPTFSEILSRIPEAGGS